MREIEFRVRNIGTNQMFIGNNQYGVDEPDTGVRASSAGAWTRFWEALARLREAEDIVLEQYTGLKDRDGRKIYEGDIVEYNVIAYTCKWNELRCEFAWYSGGKYIYPIGDMRLDLQILSKTYEDPELMRQLTPPENTGRKIRA